MDENGRFVNVQWAVFRPGIPCLLTEFGIKPADTIEFAEPKIDDEGRLILNLRTSRISLKAHSQCRKPRDLSGADA